MTQQAEFQSLEQYRGALRQALAESDPALVQDVLADLEEFLRSMSRELEMEGSKTDEATLLDRALAEFGDPVEVAATYRAQDAVVARALQTAPAASDTVSGPLGFLLDPRHLGAVSFMLIGLVTGVLYFTWAVTGLALSLGFGLLVFGLPVFFGFAASLRLFGVFEGRLIETLLGERMPRRPIPGPGPVGFWGRLRFWITDRRTWTTLLYMILKLPIGLVSFVIAVVFLMTSLAFLAVPLVQPFFDFPLLDFGPWHLWVPLWSLPIFWMVGLLLLGGLLLFARFFWAVEVRLARWMLVERPS